MFQNLKSFLNFLLFIIIAQKQESKQILSIMPKSHKAKTTAQRIFFCILKKCCRM
nr:MAG TPA: hypothetical protein [Caudoviricetes sp.]